MGVSAGRYRRSTRRLVLRSYGELGSDASLADAPKPPRYCICRYTEEDSRSAHKSITIPKPYTIVETGFFYPSEDHGPLLFVPGSCSFQNENLIVFGALVATRFCE